MEENKNNLENHEEQALDRRSLATEETQESSIDFVKLFKDLLKHKKLYYKVLPITFILAALYTLSLPNYYNCEVKLSPELSSSRSASSLASLASSFGFNLGGAAGGMGTEALFPTLYPDLMNSVDFKTSLFDVPVTIEGKDEEPDRTMSYYDYLAKEQKKTWWSAAIGGSIKWLLSLFLEEKPEVKQIDPFRLTQKQSAIVQTLNQKVVCDVDKKTMVITINVTDQNPVICANMADTVKTRLQKFITDYRTSKARVDLAYNQKLYVEAKAKYEAARNRYVAFSDSHREVSSQSARTKEADLQNEMQMQQTIYQQVAAQVQQAEMKVQQETPAFTTLQSATVPVRKSGPARAKICLVFLFLAFLCTTAYILYKEDDLKPLLGLS